MTNIPQNHNPFAEDGPDAALDVLGPIWPTVQITPLRTAFKGDMGWLEYNASGIGRVVDRFRWEKGCIVEHVSTEVRRKKAVIYNLCIDANSYKWDQGEQFPE